MIRVIGFIVAIYAFTRLLTISIENNAKSKASVKNSAAWQAIAVITMIGAGIILVLALALTGDTSLSSGR